MARILVVLVLAGFLGLVAWWNIHLFVTPLKITALSSKHDSASSVVDRAPDSFPASVRDTAEGLRSIGSSAQTLARPLFIESRRPYVPTPPAPERAVVSKDDVQQQEALRLPLPSLTILGISGSPQGNRALIIQGVEAARWVNEGDLIAGWAVAAINGASLVLAQAEEEATINLFPADAEAPVAE